MNEKVTLTELASPEEIDYLIDGKHIERPRLDEEPTSVESPTGCTILRYADGLAIQLNDIGGAPDPVIYREGQGR